MDNCIHKFLLNYKPSNIDIHSDSSGFDDTRVVPRIAPKIGKHRLLNNTDINGSKQVSEVKCKIANDENYMHPSSITDDNIPVRDNDFITHNKRNRSSKAINTVINNRGDDLTEQQTIFHSKYAQDESIPSILRRPNYIKQILSTKDIPPNNLNSAKTLCIDCERRRVKSLNRRRQNYVVQPVYTVDNVHGDSIYEEVLPFGDVNGRTPLPKRKAFSKQNFNISYELTSSESDIGTKQQKLSSHRRNFIERFEKEMRKEFIKYEKELRRNRIQQYPSKRSYDSANDVTSKPLSEIINASAVTENIQNNIPSTSSGFWEYLFDKIRGKRQPETDANLKPCFCYDDKTVIPHTALQKQTLHEEKLQKNYLSKVENYIPECKSCLQQTDNQNVTKKMSDKNIMQNDTKKVTRRDKCECCSKKNSKQSGESKDSQKIVTQTENATKPCQEPHDDVTRAVEEKYNGEILCIHNPPCILINGCLNLPATERSQIQGNHWPVIQEKKMSFYQMCKKMKRTKNITEQACQYHPPSIEVQRAMQIKAEKLVQSICNHNPPCEVVYGCHRAKYDPKLDNSCVHVPMCQRLPQCLIEERHVTNGRDNKNSKLCEHRPKCTEVPLCSRKFVVLTAKDNVGTQVRSKTKLVCRHEPPCIMIPKCLARLISNSYIPYEAIPDCVHQPTCDLIPACCRKAAREMVSVSSQYPNAPCRIV